MHIICHAFKHIDAGKFSNLTVTFVHVWIGIGTQMDSGPANRCTGFTDTLNLFVPEGQQTITSVERYTCKQIGHRQTTRVTLD